MTRRKRTPDQLARALARQSARRELARALHLAEAEAERIRAIERDRLEEILNESLAPAVMRAEIRTPDGRLIVGPRVRIVAGRAVRTPDLGDGFGHAQVQAAHRLAADWNAVGAGVNAPPIDCANSSSGGGARGDGHGAMMAQIKTRAALESALAFAGAFAPVLLRVVCHCVPVADWAAETGRDREDAIAHLGAALARLALHYAPPREARPRILTIGPPRGSYETALD